MTTTCQPGQRRSEGTVDPAPPAPHRVHHRPDPPSRDRGRAFSPANPGLDHIGLAAASRDELVAWQERFVRLGVAYTPIQDMPLGHHLNCRDPDGIPLEFQAPNDVYSALLTELRSRGVSDAEVLDRAEQVLGSEVVPRH